MSHNKTEDLEQIKILLIYKMLSKSNASAQKPALNHLPYFHTKVFQYSLGMSTH